MPNIFNADDGAISGSAGIKLSSDTSGVLNIQTNGTTAISISASQVVSFPATSGFSFAGQVTFAAGTAAAPSISVTGDTNTGIYFPAADTIAFTEGGVESMRIDASGNLGLGVTPSAWASNYKSFQLGSVSSVADTGTATRLTSNGWVNSGGTNIYLTTAAATTYIQSGGQHLWYNAPSGTAGNAITFTQAMTLHASGGLSIGSTADPGAGGVNISGTSTMSQLAVTAAGVANTTIGFNASGGTVQGIANNCGYVSIRQSYPLVFGTAETERARITSAGDFLVGVTTASYSAASRGNITVGGSDSGIYSFRIGGVDKGYFFHNGTDATIANDANGYLRFYTNANERARITATGNVGIGTTGPIAKLHVKGSGSYDGYILADNSSTTGGGIFGIGVNGTRVAFISTTGSALGDTSQDIAIYNETNSGVRFYPNGIERVRLTAAGELCIQRTTPTFNSNNRGNITIGGTDSSILFLGTGNGTGSYVFHEQSVAGMEVWNTANGYIRFGTNATERARITSGGNLLVGMTTTPSISVSNSIGHKGAANGIAGSTGMSGATWVDLVTLPTPSIAGARVNILGNENGNVNTYYGTWIIAYNSSGWGITGPFNENQRGNDYGVPNLRISGGKIQVQARNGVSSGLIYYNIEYFSV